MYCLELTSICKRFFIGEGVVNELRTELARLQVKRVAVIADSVAMKLHGDILKTALARIDHNVVIAPTSGHKTLQAVAKLAGQVEPGFPATIISFGGGVALNVAGVLAGLLYRGVPLVHVPTTLVAMVDVAPSIRQSVHLPKQKGGLGLFHSPVAVLCDTKFLETLGEVAIAEGMVEALKAAMVAPNAYNLEKLSCVSSLRAGKHLEQIIRWAVEAKLKALRGDSKEQRDGLCLHYGHTLSTALEQLIPGIPHGTAVLWGIRFAAYLSHVEGIQTAFVLREHDRILTPLRGVFKPFLTPAVFEILACLPSDPKCLAFEQQLPKATLPFILLSDFGELATSQELPVYAVQTTVVEKALDQFVKAESHHV